MKGMSEYLESADALDRWLDWMVRVNIESSRTRLDNRRMLELIRELWGDSIEQVEYHMLDRIFAATERMVRGELAPREWEDQMNLCFLEIWSEDEEENL